MQCTCKHSKKDHARPHAGPHSDPFCLFIVCLPRVFQPPNGKGPVAKEDTSWITCFWEVHRSTSSSSSLPCNGKAVWYEWWGIPSLWKAVGIDISQLLMDRGKAESPNFRYSGAHSLCAISLSGKLMSTANAKGRNLCFWLFYLKSLALNSGAQEIFAKNAQQKLRWGDPQCPWFFSQPVLSRAQPQTRIILGHALGLRSHQFWGIHSKDFPRPPGGDGNGS